MNKIAYNPYLPGYEYVPDGEPRVFGDRVYIFGSHDRSGGERYCLEDYVCWSAPVTDLAQWKYEGVIYRKEQDPDNTAEIPYPLFAPDVVQGCDGKFYLYYTLASHYYISVAVCDTPAGKYTYYGAIQKSDGQRLEPAPETGVPYDPAIFRDDDGRVWLYYGFCPHFKMSSGTVPDSEGGYCVELEQDMFTCKGKPVRVLPAEEYAAETGFEGHAFFEAASIRKIKNAYYLLYASSRSHELCYAISTKPNGGFVYGGTIISNGDIGFNGISADNARNATANIHGGLACLNGKWYVFYHRHTNGTQFSRQGCAEPITIKPDGSIPQVEMTSCGLNDGIMIAKGTTPAYIACNLYKGSGGKPIRFGPPNVEGPFVTEDHKQLPKTARVPYITNITDTSVAGFRYLEFDGTEKEMAVSIRGNGAGNITVYADDERAAPVGIFNLTVNSPYWSETTCPIKVSPGKYPLLFIFSGEGSLEMNSFTIQ
jgi:hypothetical protein